MNEIHKWRSSPTEFTEFYRVSGAALPAPLLFWFFQQDSPTGLKQPKKNQQNNQDRSLALVQGKATRIRWVLVSRTPRKSGPLRPPARPWQAHSPQALAALAPSRPVWGRSGTCPGLLLRWRPRSRCPFHHLSFDHLSLHRWSGCRIKNNGWPSHLHCCQKKNGGKPFRFFKTKKETLAQLEKEKKKTNERRNVGVPRLTRVPSLAPAFDFWRQKQKKKEKKKTFKSPSARK